jgi:hypothetical protein
MLDAGTQKWLLGLEARDLDELIDGCPADVAAGNDRMGWSATAALPTPGWVKGSSRGSGNP